MARGQWGGTGQFRPYAVRVSWQMGTNVAQTGFHLRSAALEIGGVAEAAAEVADWVTNSFRTLLDTTDRIVGIDVVNLVTFEGSSVSPASQYGSSTIGSGLAPDFLCNVVQLKGELRTKYGQGRMFFPMRNEGWEGNDVLTGPGVTAFQAVIDDMAERWIGNAVTGYNLVNVHGVLPPRPATTTRPARPEIPASWYDVTSIRLNTAVTFLRSRKAGVGS